MVTTSTRWLRQMRRSGAREVVDQIILAWHAPKLCTCLLHELRDQHQSIWRSCIIAPSIRTIRPSCMSLPKVQPRDLDASSGLHTVSVLPSFLKTQRNKGCVVLRVISYRPQPSATIWLITMCYEAPPKPGAPERARNGSLIHR